jgi:hypothetical protein
MRHVKVDGKFQCLFCSSQYSHSRDLKKHYTKHHVLEVEDLCPDDVKSLNIHRKIRPEHNRRGHEEEEKKEGIKEYETPVYLETIEKVEDLAKRFPTLGQFN